MKKLAFVLAGFALISACNNTTNEAEDKTEIVEDTQKTEYQIYGDPIDDQNTIDAADLLAHMGDQDSVLVKVKGTINSSCKVKGCWMKMDLGNGEEMHVKFKDYGFFVPKNLDGEEAIIEGFAKVETMDVDHLKHLAQDAGKSEEEIAAITEPEVSLTYLASGVLIKG